MVTTSATRIINAIWDDLIVQRDSDIPFAPSVSRSDSYIDGEVDIESVADAVIRELQLRRKTAGLVRQTSPSTATSPTG